MPPWNQMSPQQQQLFLQMLMGRGSAGMQIGSGTAAGGATPQTPTAMMPQPVPGLPQQTGLGFNPLANQQQNPMMNQQLMQYLMGLNGQGGGGMQQPTLAQLLQMHGAVPGL